MDAMIQVRDAFDLSREFHQDLSEFYAGLAGHAERMRVKLLLDWLSRHEANLQACLQRYEDDHANTVLNAWMKYAPDESPFEGLDNLALPGELTVDEVAGLALKLDAALITFYRDIADHADAADVRQLFDTLREMAESEEQDLKRRIDALWRPAAKH
jgi:hypothetical protein